ncbi:MAG: roadblock/LC7 domain-containing protein [Gemmatimonadales bacterium]|nr:roadblock/LC7 domain-containing protein [Gemmatimonadales bacterium]
MSERIRRLTHAVAEEPEGLAFLDLGDALRREGLLDAAWRVATSGVKRHPALPDAHDLLARVQSDRGHPDLAFESWLNVLDLDMHHVGAHRGLAFLYYQAGDFARAADHLDAALAHDPSDEGAQLARVRLRVLLGEVTGESRTAEHVPIRPDAPTVEMGAVATPAPAATVTPVAELAPPAPTPPAPEPPAAALADDHTIEMPLPTAGDAVDAAELVTSVAPLVPREPIDAPPPPPAPVVVTEAAAVAPPAAAPPAAEASLSMPAGDANGAQLFGTVDGSAEGLVLFDANGLRLGGTLHARAGEDVGDEVAALLAGVAREAARTASLLGLGAWQALAAESAEGTIFVVPAGERATLLAVGQPGQPLGRVAITADRAARHARRWLEAGEGA